MKAETKIERFQYESGGEQKSEYERQSRKLREVAKFKPESNSDNTGTQHRETEIGRLAKALGGTSSGTASADWASDSAIKPYAGSHNG